MRRLGFVLVSFLLLGIGTPANSAAPDAIKKITIRASRDMGYFAGDLVKADIDLLVEDGYEIETPSLPHSGPIDYWLDLRSIDVSSQRIGANRRFTLTIVYQNFYDALDARPQEIPTFPVVLTDGKAEVTADVPAWTIGVSPLREIAPPVKDDPRDYLRADDAAPFVAVASLWKASIALALAAVGALALLAYDRAWPPFRARPARVFAEAARKLRSLRRQSDDESAYLEGLLVLHRGIDRIDRRRVLADDLPIFLGLHPVFAPAGNGLARFFNASRHAFFASDPTRARAELGFDSLTAFVAELAAIERTRP